MPPQSDDVVIRSAEPGDVDAVRRIYAGPQAVRGTLQLPFSPGQLWRERLEKPQTGVWQLVACAGEEVVGHLSLKAYLENPRRRHAATLGMAVADEFRGRGIGARLLQSAVDLADRWLNLQRIELEVFVDNAPAVRLYERFGFVREGTCRQYAFRDGEFVDVHVMARVRAGARVPPATEATSGSDGPDE